MQLDYTRPLKTEPQIRCGCATFWGKQFMGEECPNCKTVVQMRDIKPTHLTKLTRTETKKVQILRNARVISDEMYHNKVYKYIVDFTFPEAKINETVYPELKIYIPIIRSESTHDWLIGRSTFTPEVKGYNRNSISNGYIYGINSSSRAEIPGISVDGVFRGLYNGDYDAGEFKLDLIATLFGNYHLIIDRLLVVGKLPSVDITAIPFKYDLPNIGFYVVKYRTPHVMGTPPKKTINRYHADYYGYDCFRVYEEGSTEYTVKHRLLVQATLERAKNVRFVVTNETFANAAYSDETEATI